MMVRLVCLAMIYCSSVNAFTEGVENNFNLEVKVEDFGKNEFAVLFETVEFYNDQCPLLVKNVTIKIPEKIEEKRYEVGSLGIELQKGLCADGPGGKYAGMIELSFGLHLPDLYGYYKLSIDGKDFKYLYVTSRGASIIPFSKIP